MILRYFTFFFFTNDVHLILSIKIEISVDTIVLVTLYSYTFAVCSFRFQGPYVAANVLM